MPAALQIFHGARRLQLYTTTTTLVRFELRARFRALVVLRSGRAE